MALAPRFPRAEHPGSERTRASARGCDVRPQARGDDDVDMKTAIRWAYFVLAWAVVADLCLQFYFAAYGTFSAGRSDFADHTSNAIVVLVLMLAALLVSVAGAATAGLGWARVIGQGVLPVLVIGQSL